MFKKLSVKWKMTILSAILIFFIFIICNIIQLILIHTFTSRQEEQMLHKRTKEIQAYISEQTRITGVNQINELASNNFFETIIENHEMIRISDQNGNVLYTSSKHFPDFQTKPPIPANAPYRIRVKDEDLLFISEPLNLHSFKGNIVIGRNIETFDSFIEKVIWVLMLGTLLSLVLSLFSGLFLARKLLYPLRGMTNTMRKIEDHQFQERMPVMENQDEFSQLSIIFNSMMDKIEESIKQQKRFVEDASHELRTPLAIIHGHLSLLKRWGKDNKDVLENSLNTSIKETNRMIELTNELLQLSKLEEKLEYVNKQKPSAVSELIDEILSNYKFIHNELKIVFENESEKEILLAIPQEQLKQVIINIIDNAIKYSGQQKEITLITREEKGNFRIEIRDTGYGISKEDLPYIFDRFYRVDKARSRDQGGNGLGLSIVKDIVEENNGQISAESTIGKGTSIILLLPYAVKKTNTARMNPQAEGK